MILEEEEDIQEGDEENVRASPIPLKIKSLQEAVQALEEVKQFLDSRRYSYKGILTC